MNIEKIDNLPYCKVQGSFEPMALMCSAVMKTPFHERCITRTRSVPCKARGVCNNHNRNAYIVIPDNPTHGLILACSHADCFNSGRRFRYCAVCQTPVAKRNFMVRHDHGLNLVRAARKKGAAATVDFVPPAPPHRREKRRSRCVSPDETALIVRRAMRELGEELAEASKERPKKMMKPASSDSDVELIQLTLEEKEWLSLLHNHPDFQDTDTSMKWLDLMIDSSMKREFSSSNDETKLSEFLAPGLLFDNSDELSDPGYKDDEDIKEDGDDFGFTFKSVASFRM